MTPTHTKCGSAAIRIFVFEDSPDSIERYNQLLPEPEVILQATTKPRIDAFLEEDLLSFEPDLFILDLLIGDSREGGYSLLRQLREIPRLSTIPIIICSKLINSSQTGQQERHRIEELLGPGTAYSKLPDLPNLDQLRIHLK